MQQNDFIYTTLEELKNTNRILIIGSPGSGKTYFSNVLFNDVYHFDDLYWKENWTRSDKEYMKNVISEILKKDKWVIEGNYFYLTFTERVRAADIVLIVKVNRFVCLSRIFKRYVLTLLGRVDHLPEKVKNSKTTRFGRLHLDKKFIKYVFNFEKNIYPSMMQEIESSGVTYYTLSMRQCKKLCSAISEKK